MNGSSVVNVDNQNIKNTGIKIIEENVACVVRRKYKT